VALKAGHDFMPRLQRFPKRSRSAPRGGRAQGQLPVPPQEQFATPSFYLTGRSSAYAAAGGEIRLPGSMEQATDGQPRSASKWRCGPFEYPVDPSKPNTMSGAT